MFPDWASGLVARSSSLLCASRRRSLGGYLGAGAAGFGQPDRYGLLAARHFLAGPAASERAVLALVHSPLDLLRRFLAVLGHRHTPCLDIPWRGLASEYSASVGMAKAV